MFADGTIKTFTDEDGEIYINMLQLVDHLYNSAIVMRTNNNSEGIVISQVLAMVGQELAKFGLYLTTVDELDDVNDVESLLDVFSKRD